MAWSLIYNIEPDTSKELDKSLENTSNYKSVCILKLRNK